MSDKKNREIDAYSGVETTGHEWDGIKELNKPLPRWWIYTFYACIVWSIGYWIVHPAWPTMNGYTKGLWNYSQRAVVAAEGEAARAAQGTLRKQIETTALGDIRKNQDLLRFAMAAGNASFQTNCSACHGRGGQGFTGIPTSTTTTGCGAATWRRSRRRSCTAYGRSRRIRGRAPCRATASTRS